MSQEHGDANIFLTLNNDVRAWKGVRKLVFELENGESAVMPPDHFDKNNDKFTHLLEKYAVQLSVYLYWKTKLFLKAFLEDICQIPSKLNQDDGVDRTAKA